MRHGVVEHVADARHVARLLVEAEHKVDAEYVAHHHRAEAQAVEHHAREETAHNVRRARLRERPGSDLPERRDGTAEHHDGYGGNEREKEPYENHGDGDGF